MTNLRRAFTDPNLFGRHFEGASWANWRALLAGFDGQPLSKEEADVFRALTAREPLTEPASELWLPIGRRGGKTSTAAGLGVWYGAQDYSDRLAPGEVATTALIAGDRQQARSLMRYATGLIDQTPLIADAVARTTGESITFKNGNVIEIMTASFRGLRGYSLAAAIFDECAFWQSAGRNPDEEIVRAVRPALATLDGKLIAISSPYAKSGILWRAYNDHFGGDDPRVLVAQAPTRLMNPTVPQAIIDRAYRDDPEAAKAEWGAEFRGDLAQFIDAELVDKCSRPKNATLPPMGGTQYMAFVDPAGGGADEFTLAIGHLENGTAVVDLVRGMTGSPAEITQQYCHILKEYRVRRVTGDRYAGRWSRDEFAKGGIDFQTSAMPRSELYLEALPAFHDGNVELPPDPKLARQFAGLERRTSRSGRDSVDHPPGGSDDRANAAAGVIAHLLRSKSGGVAQFGTYSSSGQSLTPAQQRERQRRGVKAFSAC